MGTCGQVGYVFRDFCLRKGIDFINFCLKVSATLKIAIFPYLRFQRFQIDMLESFLLKKKLEENIVSVERYRG